MVGRFGREAEGCGEGLRVDLLAHLACAALGGILGAAVVVMVVDLWRRD